MATIFKKKGVWYLDYYLHGQRKRKCLKTSSKRMAKLALNDLEVKLAKNDIGLMVKEINVDEFFKEFLEYQKPRISPQSYKRMETVTRVHLLPFFKKHHIKNINDITSWLIEKYINERTKKVKESTANYEIGIIKNMLNNAVKWGYLATNPATSVKFLKVKNKKPPRYLTIEEINALLKACKGQLYYMVLVGLHTGMRSGEICQLEWEDIELKKGIITVVNDGERTTKSNRTRFVPVNEELLTALEQYGKKKKERVGRLFKKRNGRLMTVHQFWVNLRNAYARAGIKGANVHTLRHTYASHLVMKGVDIYTVGKLLGHSKVQTTQIYAHLAPDHLKSAVNNLPKFGHQEVTVR